MALGRFHPAQIPVWGDVSVTARDVPLGTCSVIERAFDRRVNMIVAPRSAALADWEGAVFAQVGELTV